MHEFVKVVLMSRAKINERLYGLIRIGRERLMLRGGDDFDGVIGEDCKVGNRVVNIGRFVDADEWLVEYCEEGAKESECRRLYVDVSANHPACSMKGTTHTSSIKWSIISLSRCLMCSLSNCFKCANSTAPCFISSSTCALTCQ